MRQATTRAATVLILLAALGCRRDMQDQPRYDPFEASAFFPDGRASRPRVPGTVARGHLNDDEPLFTGKRDGTYVATLPVAMTRPLLERGQQRFEIYCSPCHDRVGTGHGIVVQRGYMQPTSFHVERLRMIPVGYLFDVMTNGFGVMPAYAPQVPPADRWAIAGYIRALQRSQHAAVADVPASDQPKLDVASALPSFDADSARSLSPARAGSAPALLDLPGRVERGESSDQPGEGR